MPPAGRILLYVPNVIGYVRLLLAVAMVILHCNQRRELAVAAYMSSVLLDFFDGYLARRLNQCSKFGELLDVFADNVLRTLLLILLVPQLPPRLAAPLCALPILLEWACLTCSHAGSFAATPARAGWKSVTPHQPWLVRAMFANGFKNVVGGNAIAGLFFFPLLLYVRLNLHLPDLPFAVFGVWLALGRLLCACGEAWIIFDHLRTVLGKDANLLLKCGGSPKLVR